MTNGKKVLTMDEYIKREAALDIFGDVPMWNGYFEPYPWEVHCAIVGVTKLLKEEISKISADDVVPIRHGRWEWFEEWNPSTPDHPTECEDCGWRCSECKISLDDVVGGYWDDPDDEPKLKYCPNCGAKMDERDE